MTGSLSRHPVSCAACSPAESRCHDAGVTELDDFVAHCLSLLDEPDVGDLVQQAMVPMLTHPNPMAAAIEDLRPAAGRAAMVHRSENLTVIGIEVAEGFVSPPHNHHLWSVVGVYRNEEHNTFYRRSGNGIEQTGEATLHTGDAMAFPADAIHRIANIGTGPMRALHVYGGDLFAAQRSEWDDQTGEERPFGSAR